MDDLSHSGSTSWDPFSDNGDIGPSDLGSDEKFIGDDLKAYFDNEEKMYQSASSTKSDQSHQLGEKSSAMQGSGFMLRSFMADSGDSDLINQKLTMSQYIAHKSEPMGCLGDSASSRERPYFSFKDKSLQQSSNSEKSENGVAEFNPDFSQEPSWLRKKSLSSLSSSENLEIPSKSPDCSENWLVGKHVSVSSNILGNPEKSNTSNQVEELAKSSSDSNMCATSSSLIVTEKFSISNHVRELSRRPSSSTSIQKEQDSKQEPSIQQEPVSGVGQEDEPSIQNEQEITHCGQVSKGNLVSKTEDKSAITNLKVHEIGETSELPSELPSLYWKPHDNESHISHIDISLSYLESGLEKRSHCNSYVAGHVDSLLLGSDNSRRPSEVAASSQSSSSPASTVRENTDFPRCDSIISEPQLSSTREITDDFSEVSTTGRRVHFLPDSYQTEVSNISMEKRNLRLDTLLEVPSKPNLCSTAMTPTVKASERIMRILANLSKSVAEHEPESHQQAKALDFETTATNNNTDVDWEQLERDLTQHEAAGFSPESWVAVFSNTSSLSTPVLMNKIKEHVLRLNGRGMSSDLLPSESSGIGGSGFEITETRANSDFDPSTNKGPTTSVHQPLANKDQDISSRMSSVNMKNPPQEEPTQVKRQPMTTPTVPSPVEPEGKFLMKNRHTLSVMPSMQNGANSELHTPVGGCEFAYPFNEKNQKAFTQITSTVIKKVPHVPAVSKPSHGPSKAKGSQLAHALQAPLVKCNKSHVYFGGSNVRQTQTQNLVVRNASFKEAVELELRIKDSDAFYILEEDRSLVSHRGFKLEPRQECCIDLAFKPQSLGQLATKLNIYPRCESAKNVKYTVELSGYGGSSKIQQLISKSGHDNGLVPKSKGSYWHCQFVIENRGNVAGFVFIQPLQDNGAAIENYQCIVRPQLCSVNAGDFKEVEVFIHPTKDRKCASFKLQIVWGDEPLRVRWMKSIFTGAPIVPTADAGRIDWSRLLQLESNDNQPIKPAASEEDTPLFFNNVKLDEVMIAFPDNGQDSHFVTLAVEPATVLEASNVASDTMLSQRRLTTATSARPQSDQCVSAAITELVFPSTKVGSISSQKIPLQNWSGAVQEVRVKEINGPFSMKHNRSAVPAGYYSRLPIQFHPTKSGSHSGTVVLDVGHNGQPLSIALRGDAFC